MVRLAPGAAKGVCLALPNAHERRWDVHTGIRFVGYAQRWRFTEMAAADAFHFRTWAAAWGGSSTSCGVYPEPESEGLRSFWPSNGIPQIWQGWEGDELNSRTDLREVLCCSGRIRSVQNLRVGAKSRQLKMEFWSDGYAKLGQKRCGSHWGTDARKYVRERFL